MSEHLRQLEAGEMTLQLEDGTVLHAATEVGLAHQWAAHTHGDAWESMGPGRQAMEVSDALDALTAAWCAAQ